MTPGLGIFLISLVPVALRAWLGWRYGATREIRHLLVYVFAMLVALRFWYQGTEVALRFISRDPRVIAACVYLVLFVLAAGVAAFVVRLRGEFLQSVQPNPVDNLLGSVAGLLSGAIIGCSLLLMVTVAFPELSGSSDPQTSPLLQAGQYPLDVFRLIEQKEVPARCPAHSPLPKLSNADNPAAKPPEFLWN